MKKILALLTLTFAINAYALTVDDLVKRYGKQAIMNVIAGKLDNIFMMKVDGSTKFASPNINYINVETLTADLKRAGMSAIDVESVLLEKIEQAKKIEQRKAEEQRKIAEEMKRKQEERRKQDAILAEEKAKQEAILAEEKAKHDSMIAKKKAEEDALLPEEKEERLKQQKQAEYRQMLEQKVQDYKLEQAIKNDIQKAEQQPSRSAETEPNKTISSIGMSCELDSFTLGVERNVDGCNREMSSYGSPQPGGECVSLLGSAELLSDYLNKGISDCSPSQENRARSATNAAISTLRRTQSR